MASQYCDIHTLHIALKQTFEFTIPKPILNKLEIPIKDSISHSRRV